MWDAAPEDLLRKAAGRSRPLFPANTSITCRVDRILISTHMPAWRPLRFAGVGVLVLAFGVFAGSPVPFLVGVVLLLLGGFMFRFGPLSGRWYLARPVDEPRIILGRVPEYRGPKAPISLDGVEPNAAADGKPPGCLTPITQRKAKLWLQVPGLSAPILVARGEKRSQVRLLHETLRAFCGKPAAATGALGAPSRESWLLDAGSSPGQCWECRPSSLGRLVNVALWGAPVPLLLMCSAAVFWDGVSGYFCLFGSIGASAWPYILQYVAQWGIGTRRISFDRRTGRLTGRTGPSSGSVRFDLPVKAVGAVQLCPREDGVSELNVIMMRPAGLRLHVLALREEQHAREKARELAAFLNVPLLEGTADDESQIAAFRRERYAHAE